MNLKHFIETELHEGNADLIRCSSCANSINHCGNYIIECFTDLVTRQDREGLICQDCIRTGRSIQNYIVFDSHNKPLYIPLYRHIDETIVGGEGKRIPTLVPCFSTGDVRDVPKDPEELKPYANTIAKIVREEYKPKLGQVAARRKSQQQSPEQQRQQHKEEDSKPNS